MIGSLKLTSFQAMELGRIFKDLATGQTALLERSAFTLAGSMGLLSAAITGLFTVSGAVVVAFAAVAAVMGVLAYKAIEAAKQQDEFTKALASNNDASGVSAK